ncbi:MAG: right-handed parallel beta-helix repeat-containing protein [Synergistaceae bacterium]
MAIYYIDLASGNDSNDGSAGNPFKTIDHVIGLGGGPHDIRVAKTTAASTVGGATTFGWTYNSSDISTSTDLTASLAANDVIGKPTAQGNGNSETFYRITAVTATKITINSVYAGETGNTVGALKINPETVVSAGGIASFTSSQSVSGGWNLLTQLQDGETWCKPDVLNENMFQLTANDVSISKINVINCGGINPNADRRFSLEYSSFDVDGAFIDVRANSSISITNCAITWGTSTSGYGIIIYNPPYSGEYHTFQNNYIVSGAGTKTGIYYVLNAFNGVDELILGGNVWVGLTVGLRMTTGSTIDISTDAFYDCTSGISSGNNANNIYIENGEFHGGTYGFVSGYFTTVYITKTEFYDCQYGISNTQMKDLIIYDCYFESCDVGVWVEQNSSGVKIVNCDFVTPVTAGVAKQAPRTPPPQIINCTIDAASEIKALAMPSQLDTAYIAELPIYIIRNSFNNYPDGAYYPYSQLIKDNGVKMGASPSLRFSTNIDMTVNTKYWIPIIKYYAQSGNSYTFKIYIKSLDLWFGSLGVRWTMARDPLKSESTITSLSDDWVEYSWTIADTFITENGILSIEVLYNGNATPIWFDRPTIDGQASSPFLFLDSCNRLRDSVADDIVFSDFYSGFYPLAGGYTNENQYQSQWSGNIS